MAMRRRSVRPLAVEELDALTTERLLAYRAKLLALEESVDASDLDPDEAAALPAGFLYFKQDPAWQEHYASLKAILGGRAHVE